VLITDVTRTSDTTFVAGVHWPRRHPYFGPWRAEDVPLSPELALETLRQAAIALAHLHLGVPQGQAFVMETMHVEVGLDAFRPADRTEAPTIDIVVTDLVERKGVATQFDADLTVRIGDVVVARGGGITRTIPGPIYRRMREGATLSTDLEASPRLPPLAAELVGVTSEDFVLLAETPGGELTLSIDTTNPTWFDHPLDHVPGMVILEAALQAFRFVTRSPTLRVFEVDVEFASHLELNEPALLTLEVTENQLLASFHQGDEVTSRVVATSFRRTGA
jgi:hypothetical protein